MFDPFARFATPQPFGGIENMMSPGGMGGGRGPFGMMNMRGIPGAGLMQQGLSPFSGNSMAGGGMAGAGMMQEGFDPRGGNAMMNPGMMPQAFGQAGRNSMAGETGFSMNGQGMVGQHGGGGAEAGMNPFGGKSPGGMVQSGLGGQNGNPEANMQARIALIRQQAGNPFVGGPPGGPGPWRFANLW